MDSLCDIIVFATNSLSLLGSATTKFEAMFDYKRTGRRTFNKTQVGWFLTSQLCGLLDTEYDNGINNKIECFSELIDDSIFYCLCLGYDPKIAMQETLKEISSRVGAYSEETGKWEKDKSHEAQANWYKADYSLAKVS